MNFNKNIYFYEETPDDKMIAEMFSWKTGAVWTLSFFSNFFKPKKV
jgi:hypothetical protein